MLAQNAMTPFTVLKDLKDYLVKLDNSHAHDLPSKTRTPRTTTSRTARETSGRSSMVTPSRKAGPARVPVCYRCGEIGHFQSEKAKCKEDQQTPKGKAAQEAAVKEIELAEMDGLATDSGSDSISDSAKE